MRYRSLFCVVLLGLLTIGPFGVVAAAGYDQSVSQDIPGNIEGECSGECPGECPGECSGEGTIQTESSECKYPSPVPGIRDSQLTYEMDPVEFVCMDARSLVWRETYLGNYWSFSFDFITYSVGEIYKDTEKGSGWYQTTTLMKYDTSPGSVPYMKEFQKAELVLSPVETTTIGDVGVYRALGEWNLNSNFSDSSENGRYPGPVEMDEGHPQDLQTPTNSGQRYTWDITDLYRGWLEGSVKNQGIFLALNDPHDKDDPKPSPGSPLNYTTDLSLKKASEGNLPSAPSLVITYIGNDAPLAMIDDVSPDKPIEGKPIYLNGSGTDPDGNNIVSYKWVINDEMIIEGPNKNHVTVDLIMGKYDIQFYVKDDDEFPRWSQPATKTVLVDSLYTNTPPVVSGITASLNGETGTSFPEGAQIDFQITERMGMEELEGTMSVMGENSLLINKDPLTDEGGGNYSYTWHTLNTPPGTYWVDVTLLNPATGMEDIDGLLPGMDTEIEIVDITPPEVGQVVIPTGIESGIIQPGTHVTVFVWEALGEPHCSGTLDITGPREGLENPLENRGSGIYAYEWDTTGWPDGYYELNVKLADRFNNIADPPGEELSVEIYDTVAPDILSVFTVQVDDLFEIKVQASSQETDLIGHVEAFGPDSFQEDMYELGDGWYAATINTTELEAGVYDLDIYLTDTSGNSDYDSAVFTVESRNPSPTIVEYSPDDGAIVLTADFAIEITFSEGVTTDSPQWAILVWDSRGDPVAGDLTLDEKGTVAIFEPEDGWLFGEYYTVSVSPGFTDDEGAYLSGFTSWDFSVIAPDAPQGTDRSPQGTEVDITQGSSQIFSAQFSHADEIRWYTAPLTNGSGPQVWTNEGTGTTFNYTPSRPGLYAVKAVGTGPGGEDTVSWTVDVKPGQGGKGGGGDGSGDDSGTEDSGASDNNALAVAVAVVGVLLIVLVVILFLRDTMGRGGSRVDSGTPANVKADGRANAKNSGTSPDRGQAAPPGRPASSPSPGPLPTAGMGRPAAPGGGGTRPTGGMGGPGGPVVKKGG